MNILDDFQKMEKLDVHDMYHKIIHLPQEVYFSYNNSEICNRDQIRIEKINRIIICGMGGSAISADIARSAFEKIIPIEVCKSYDLPYCDKDTLVIELSFSGNTEETLSCLHQAIERSSPIAAITSGGKMQEIVQSKFPWIRLEGGIPPRAAVARLFFALIRLLETYQIIPDQRENVKKTVSHLIGKAGAIARAVPTEENIAKDSALKINNKIPVIYSITPSLLPLAYRWKCQINENAKYPAFCHTFSEMNHNEIEGWEAIDMNSHFIPIILSHLIEKGQIQKRKNLLKKIWQEQNIEYLEFYVEGDNLIEETFSLLYLGDMISYYLAILRNVDPTEIQYINRLKENL